MIHARHTLYQRLTTCWPKSVNQSSSPNWTATLDSLSTCSTLWDNYAYFLSNFKVSGHTSKPFKCKSTDTYIIPGENRTISSSFRATTGQWVGLILSSSFLTRVLACLLIYFLSLEPFWVFDSRDGTTEGHSAAIISATMSKDLALNSIPLEPSVHIVNQKSVTPTSNAEGTIPAD